MTQSLLDPIKRRSLALPNRQYSPPPSLDSLAVSSIPLDVSIKFLKISYFGYHFPAEIIHHTIWLYLRFMLKFRNVEDLLTERKILVAYKTAQLGEVFWTQSHGRSSKAHIKAVHDLAPRRGLS